MHHTTAALGESAHLDAYLHEVPGEGLPASDAALPAVLVLPGGAYRMISPVEGEPVALAYHAEGYQAFVLSYTTTGAFEPAWRDAEAALELIHANANAWNVDASRIAVCGFSAGGHLAAALATTGRIRPRAAVLGYPTLLEPRCLTPCLPEHNMVARVDASTAPTFLFACADDPMVPAYNSTEMARACLDAGVPVECHIYRNGGHAFGLGRRLEDAEAPADRSHASSWFQLSLAWLEEMLG